MIKFGKEGYAGLDWRQLHDELDSDTINIRILWEDKIITRDHRVMQRVATSGFGSFQIGTAARLCSYSLLGDGIFTSDGAAWMKHRALIKPFFGT